MKTQIEEIQDFFATHLTEEKSDHFGSGSHGKNRDIYRFRSDRKKWEVFSVPDFMKTEYEIFIMSEG